jgi:hypothetical protein
VHFYHPSLQPAALAGSKLSCSSDFQSSCLSLPSAGITGLWHQAWLSSALSMAHWCSEPVEAAAPFGWFLESLYCTMSLRSPETIWCLKWMIYTPGGFPRRDIGTEFKGNECLWYFKYTHFLKVDFSEKLPVVFNELITTFHKYLFLSLWKKEILCTLP